MPGRTFILVVASAAAVLQAASPDQLVREGHFKRASGPVAQRLKVNPADAQAAYLMSKIKQAYGEIESAVNFAAKAVSVDAANAEYHNQLGQLYGRQAQRASVFQRGGLAKRCRSTIEAALSLDPNHFEAQVTLMVFLAQAPGIVGGDKKRAYAMADTLSRRDPVLGWLARAQLAEELKEPAKLDEAYRNVLAIDPGHLIGLTNYSNILLNAKPPKLDLAEKHARAALKIDPSRAAPYTVLATRFALADRIADMEAILAQSERNVPDNLAPHFAAARVLTERGIELGRAESYLRKYLTQPPEGNAPLHAHAHWALGLLLERLGRRPEAIAELESALRQKGDFEPARKELRRLKS